MEIKDLRKLRNSMIIFIIIIFFLIMFFKVTSSINEYNNEKENQKNSIYKQTDYIYKSKINIINRTFTNRLHSIVSQGLIIEAVKARDRETLYKISLKRFKTIKRDFPTLSIMHYHLPDFTSLLRVHEKDKFGDNLKDKRAMIKKAIETKSTQIGFESGVYKEKDIIYRVAIPIMEDDKLVCVVELGIDTRGILSKFDNFFRASSENKVYIGFLLPKDKGKINILKNCKIISNSKYINKIIKKLDYKNSSQDVKIDGKTYFVFWDKQKLNDFNVDKVGTILYGFDITELEDAFIHNVMVAFIKPFIMMFIFGLILTILFNYIIKENLAYNIKINSIVDNQTAIIAVTNGKKLLKVNKSFLDFFNILSLERFLESHSCICDKFIVDDGYLQKQILDENWLEYMISNSDKIHKVKILDISHKEHIFQVNYKEFNQDTDSEYVISFEDITALELELEKNIQKDQQLIAQSRLAQMGEMLSMIAHQWRQPLSAISSSSGALILKARLNKVDKETVIEISEKISGYSQHLSDTIEDFRDFFKSNKEKRNITYDILITSILKIVEISIINKNIELVKILNSKNSFSSYPNELKQVILNLIKNAEDILLENNIVNPKITIETKDNILTISDNGGGIPLEIMDKIFDPYFSTKMKKDGTGLGLYMSKTIIEEHCDGELTVSNDEEGAVFKILLKEN